MAPPLFALIEILIPTKFLGSPSLSDPGIEQPFMPIIS